MIRILSFNCRGLGNLSKRQDVLSYLKTKKAQIYCLQDTHFVPQLQSSIIQEWGGKCFFSFKNSQSRGVGVLIADNCDI